MVTRIFSLIALLGPLLLGAAYLLEPDAESIAVTYSGSFPAPVETDVGGQSAAPASCNVTVAFLPIERQVTHLRATFAILKDGAEIGRGTVAVERLVYDAENNQWAATSFPGKCDADELLLLEARAAIDGEPTNLIASEKIHASDVIPWLPIGSEITIPDPTDG